MAEGINVQQSIFDRREIRFFISSTFGDMQEEREELVKQVFPQLRRLCESRGVTWGEVDLRWGVPDEAKAEGNVLRVCLQEIDHCRPYFIGILGERYGWVPEEIPESLFETHPWLRENIHQSVTALEILHGVLRNPDMEKHALFYFRDPAYAAAHRGFTEEDPILREKLVRLKSDIRKSGFPVREPFTTPKQLGEWVMRDLTAVIEYLYPEKDIPNALDRAAFDHEAYSASRRTVYVGRQEYMDRLNAHAAGNGPPLVIVGESGGGKSALLANWTRNWSERHPETPVLIHFIGAAPDSSSWMAMLRRLLGEFQRKFGIQIEIPDQPEALRVAFANSLYMAAAHGCLVLAFDALNQIEDHDGAPDLVWLPPAIPSNVRLIVSTLPGRPWDDLKKRGWPVLSVEPLTVPEREELIQKYLKRYSKTLSGRPAHRIAAAPQTDNGLYLSTLLNELRQFGSHEQLDKRIDWYLEAASPVELYRKVIQRWEQDYGQPHPVCKNIARESLRRLWAARRGLSETELLESLGNAGYPLPRAVWSPLFLAAGDALVNRGGLLTFAHYFLSEAVRDEYLDTEAHEQDAHRTLATYFESQQQGPRQLDELPWQLREACDWDELHDLLAKRSFFLSAWSSNDFEVRGYWSVLEANSRFNMMNTYRPDTWQCPSREDAEFLFALSQLMSACGHIEQSCGILAHLTDYFRSAADFEGYARTVGGQAAILYQLGKINEAQMLFKEQERLCRREQYPEHLQTSLNGQALILADLGDLEGASRLHEEQAKLCSRAGLERFKANAEVNQAWVVRKQGNLSKALTLQRSAEVTFRKLGDLDGLGTCLENQGLILWDMGQTDDALSLHQQAEAICRKCGNQNGLQRALGNQALVLKDRGELEAALSLYREKEDICRKIGNLLSLSIALGEHALVLQDAGLFDNAMELHKEEESISRQLGNPDCLQRSIGNQALILSQRGDLAGALSLTEEKERICRQFVLSYDLALCLVNRGSLLAKLGRAKEGLPLVVQGYEWFSNHGYASRLHEIETVLNRVREASQLLD